MSEDRMNLVMIGGPWDGQVYSVPPCHAVVIPLTESTLVEVPVKSDGDGYWLDWEFRSEREVGRYET